MLESNSNPPSINDIDAAPTELPAPNGSFTEKNYDELLEKFTRVSNEKFELLEQVSALRTANGTRQILDDLIKPYAGNAFKFMCYYSSIVGSIIFLDGSKFNNFSLPESVLQLLVGSTAVTVIGLVGMVMTGVFVGAGKK